MLLAINQALAQWLGAADERVGYTYLLRVLGFVLILAAIVDKNVSDRKTQGRSRRGRIGSDKFAASRVPPLPPPRR